MAYSRFDKRSKFKNMDEMFKEHFKKRDVNHIVQYTSPVFNHVDANTDYKFTEDVHIWKANDRLYKLAHEHYGDSALWWVIAWYNKKPTEAHFEIGETIYIPKPLEEILNVMGV